MGKKSKAMKVDSGITSFMKKDISPRKVLR